MSRLFFLLYALIGPTLAGVGVVIVLTMGMDTLRPILTAAAVGFALGVPAAWIVMRQLVGEADT
ncbi:MAG: CTP synthetase [Paracoccaceae bacterium]